MSQPEVYPVPQAWAEGAQVNAARYADMRAQAAADPEAFFGEAARRLDWIRPPTLIKDVSFDAEDRHGESIVIDAAYVDQQLAAVARNTDLSKYVL